MKTGKKIKLLRSWEKIWAKLDPMLRKEVKKLALSIGFFLILHGEYLLKHKVVVAQTPEREFQVNIASNATFEGCQGQILAQFGSKMGKN